MVCLSEVSSKFPFVPLALNSALGQPEQWVARSWGTASFKVAAKLCTSAGNDSLTRMNISLLSVLTQGSLATRALAQLAGQPGNRAESMFRVGSLLFCSSLLFSQFPPQILRGSAALNSNLCCLESSWGCLRQSWGWGQSVHSGKEPTHSYSQRELLVFSVSCRGSFSSTFTLLF